ncbi:hypothetical protein DL98DRAFT_660512 [Cadophora sp. DSE1049]|nr:hypothetical protein DL98DRAFT_660512 [Cadophora sp. DSE1049]
MKQDERFGILLRCRIKLDRISERICDTHHEVGLEEMEEIEEHIPALDEFMRDQPVDDPIYPGGPPASILEQLCGFYDHDASSSDDESSDDEDLPPQDESERNKPSPSATIEEEDPTATQATNSESEPVADEVSKQLSKPDQSTSTLLDHLPRSKSPRNKREKVKKPKTKTSAAFGGKSGNSSKGDETGVEATKGMELAAKRSISAKKPSMKIPRDERSVLILEHREMAGVPLSSYGQPRLLKVRYLDLVQGSEVIRDLFTLKSRGGMEGQNDKLDQIIYNPRMPYVSKRYIRDLVLYLPTFLASDFAKGRKHHRTITALSKEQIWAGMVCWVNWLKHGRIEVGTEKKVQRGVLFTAAFLHMEDEYLQGVLKQVPKQRMKRKRGETYEYLEY